MIDNLLSAVIRDKFFSPRAILYTLHKRRTCTFADNIPSITTSDNVKLLPPRELYSACICDIYHVYWNMCIGNKGIFTIAGKKFGIQRRRSPCDVGNCGGKLWKNFEREICAMGSIIEAINRNVIDAVARARIPSRAVGTMDLGRRTLQWKYGLFTLTDNAQLFTRQCALARSLSLSLSDRAIARFVAIAVCARSSVSTVELGAASVGSLYYLVRPIADKITAEWIVLHSAPHLYTLGQCAYGESDERDQPVIYISSRVWTNNTSLFLSLFCFLSPSLSHTSHLISLDPRLLVFESRLFTSGIYIYRSRHSSHTKIPFEWRTSFLRRDKSSRGPFSGKYVAERYCDK